jgi:hypothetical protein
MPEVNDYFPELEALDATGLLQERETLLRTSSGAYADLPDDILAKLVAVNRMLRRKQSGPPRKASVKAIDRPLEDLA